MRYLSRIAAQVRVAASRSMSSTALTQLDTCSARNERIDTLRCRSSLKQTSGRFSRRCTTSPAPYSLSCRRGETWICQSGKLRSIAPTHSPMPASPVLISCPPPTRQTTTAQSGCRSRQEIKNSGSGNLEAGHAFLAFHEGGGLLQIPGSLRLVKDSDMLDRWALPVFQALVTEMVDVLDEP